MEFILWMTIMMTNRMMIMRNKSKSSFQRMSQRIGRYIISATRTAGGHNMGQCHRLEEEERLVSSSSVVVVVVVVGVEGE